MAPTFRRGTVVQRTPSLWFCPSARRPHFRGIGSVGPGAAKAGRSAGVQAGALTGRGSPHPPRAVGSVPPWYVPRGPSPALEAAPFSKVSREPRSRIISRERTRPALFAVRAGPWRSGRTSASPRAARRAPRRKCEGRRGEGGRCPGAPGGTPRQRDGGDAGRMAAAARPEQGRCCHGVRRPGVGPAGREQRRTVGEEGLSAAQCGLRTSAKKPN